MVENAKQPQAQQAESTETLSWFERLWPFGREKRAQRRKIERAFQEQLQEAYQRRGDLEDAARQLRVEREHRQQAESQRVPIRQKLVSRPSFQE